MFEEIEKLVLVGQEQVEQERRKDNVEQEYQRVGKKGAFFTDVFLIGLEKYEGQKDMKSECGAGHENENRGQPPNLRASRKKIQKKCNTGVQREKVGGKSNHEI